MDTAGTSGWKLFTGNTTITGLLVGSHKLRVFLQTEDTSPGYCEGTVAFQVGSNTEPSFSSYTPTPSVPEFSWLTILPILLTIPIIGYSQEKTAKKCLTKKSQENLTKTLYHEQAYVVVGRNEEKTDNTGSRNCLVTVIPNRC